VFNLSGSEIVVILLLALVVLGPDKLPDAMRKAGKAFAEFKKLTTGFQDEVRKGFEEPTNELRKTANTLRDAATVPGFTASSKSKSKSTAAPKSKAKSESTASSTTKNRPATYPDKPHYNPDVDPPPELPEGSSVAVTPSESDAMAPAEAESVVDAADQPGVDEPAVDERAVDEPVAEGAEADELVAAGAEDGEPVDEETVGPDMGA
jgi:sec-independent protein translocase protein TatB